MENYKKINEVKMRTAEWAKENPAQYFDGVVSQLFNAEITLTLLTCDQVQHIERCLENIGYSWEDVLKETAELDAGYCGGSSEHWYNCYKQALSCKL